MFCAGITQKEVQVLSLEDLHHLLRHRIEHSTHSFHESSSLSPIPDSTQESETEEMPQSELEDSPESTEEEEELPILRDILAKVQREREQREEVLKGISETSQPITSAIVKERIRRTSRKNMETT